MLIPQLQITHNESYNTRNTGAQAAVSSEQTDISTFDLGSSSSSARSGIKQGQQECDQDQGDSIRSPRCRLLAPSVPMPRTDVGDWTRIRGSII